MEPKVELLLMKIVESDVSLRELRRVFWAR